MWTLGERLIAHRLDSCRLWCLMHAVYACCLCCAVTAVRWIEHSAAASHGTSCSLGKDVTRFLTRICISMHVSPRCHGSDCAATCPTYCMLLQLTMTTSTLPWRNVTTLGHSDLIVRSCVGFFLFSGPRVMSEICRKSTSTAF